MLNIRFSRKGGEYNKINDIYIENMCASRANGNPSFASFAITMTEFS